MIERVECDRAELFRKTRSGKMVNVFYEERIEPELATASKLSGGVVFADIGVFIVGADGKILDSPHWDSTDPKELDPQELGVGDSGPIDPAVADRLSDVGLPERQ